ncbi:MAG: prephenate dehydrogenase/arogenate dehydrogenase family protein [Alphaproteobacteria bacterium]|nr:prephenate dehydrogenase/arogenate dehydrogenase family protein [Alphaproteobacteria bacterium]
MEKDSLGLIGAGSFGAFAAQHLAPHFDLVLHDALVDTTVLARELKACSGDLGAAAACDIVVLAVPVQKMHDVLTDIAPLLKTNALVVDVASVKIRPVRTMQSILPASVSIVGTHPLFGPQSGKNGISGLNIAVCDVRGDRGAGVARFCTEKLGLRVTAVTPEEHDREAAYVQGLTHMLGKIVVALDLPPMRFPTKTYELMQQMVEMIRYDSDELFRAIQSENPFSEEAKLAFFTAAKDLEDRLMKKD